MATETFTQRSPIPWKFLLLTFLVLAIVTTSVPLVNWMTRPQGSAYTGYTYESWADIFVYLNFIDQGAHDHVLFKNFMTSEPQKGSLFLPLFLVLGKLSAWGHVSPLIAWHIGRLLLMCAFLVVLARFLALLHLRKTTARFVFLFIVASGGIFARVHEGSAFLALLYSPMTTFSLTATLVYFSAFFRNTNGEKTLNTNLILVLLPLLQAMVHPYILLLWGAIPLVYLSFLVFTRQRSLRSVLSVGALSLLGTGIAAGYLMLLLWSNNILWSWARGGYLPGWSLSTYLLLDGGLLPIAITGALTLRRSSRMLVLHFLLVWGAVTLFFSVAPTPYSGRMLLLLHIPLAVLAGCGLTHLWETKNARPVWRLVLFLTLLIACADNIHHLVANWSGRYKIAENRYISADEQRAVSWIRNNTKEDAVLFGALNWDTLLPQQTYRQVFTTFQQATVNLHDTYKQSLSVYAGHYAPEDLQELLERNGVDYLLYGPREQRSGLWEYEHYGYAAYAQSYSPHFNPARYNFLLPVYHDGGFFIYQVVARRQ